MAGNSDSSNLTTKKIRWIARIWSIPIIVYTLIVLIGAAWNLLTTGVADPYAVEDYTLVGDLAPLFILMGIVGLGVAWFRERLGGTVTVAFQIIAISLSLFQRPITQDFASSAVPILVAILVAIPGILFLVCWRRSTKRTIAENNPR